MELARLRTALGEGTLAHFLKHGYLRTSRVESTAEGQLELEIDKLRALLGVVEARKRSSRFAVECEDLARQTFASCAKSRMSRPAWFVDLWLLASCGFDCGSQGELRECTDGEFILRSPAQRSQMLNDGIMLEHKTAVFQDSRRHACVVHRLDRMCKQQNSCIHTGWRNILQHQVCTAFTEQMPLSPGNHQTVCDPTGGGSKCFHEQSSRPLRFPRHAELLHKLLSLTFNGTHAGGVCTSTANWWEGAGWHWSAPCSAARRLCHAWDESRKARHGKATLMAGLRSVRSALELRQHPAVLPGRAAVISRRFSVSYQSW